MIKVGTKDITDIRLGNTAVKAVYFCLAASVGSKAFLGMPLLLN